MRVAIPNWEGRVSPVLDSAGSVLLVDVADGLELRREERPLLRSEALVRAGELLRLQVEVVICGAISAPLEAALVSAGVRVFGFVCGGVEDILAAFLSGGLTRQAYLMPGCRGRRGQIHGRRRTMPGGSGMGFGGGRGGGFGGGRGGGRARRMGGPAAGGPGGECVCPNCGERAPHASGQPCNQTKCPKCGAFMTRA